MRRYDKLIVQVANQLTCSKVEARHVIDTVFQIIISEVQSDGPVFITNFGSFKQCTICKPAGYNFKTGEQLGEPTSMKTIKFQPSSVLKERL